MSARQVLFHAIREQLVQGLLALLAFALGAGATAGLAALSGPALATLDPSSGNAAAPPQQLLAGYALTTLQVLLGAAALMLVRAGSRYGGTLAAGSVQQHAVRKLRIHIHDHLLHLSPSAWAQLAPGELAGRLGAEVAAVRSLVHVVVSHTFQHIMVAAALATLAIQLDTRVATYAFLMAAPLAGMTWWLARAARPATLAVHEAEARVAELAGEHAALVPLVRAYGAEGYASDQLSAAATRSETAALVALEAHQRVGPSLEVAAALGVGALAWFGAAPLPFTTAVSLFAALLLMMRPLQALASALPAAYAGVASLERMEQILALPRVAPADAPQPAASPDAAAPTLALRDVSFAYPGGQAVLRDVSLELRAGERVALTGRSGEGKTTLLMVLAGLLPPSSGARFVDGARCAQVRADMAWVPQDALFFADTLLANVAFGAPPDAARATRALQQAGLGALLGSLPDGLNTVLAGRARQLSGGERQRLSIARGLYRRPRVLLLDEVTSALDAASEADVLATLTALADTGTTLVFVSHRPTVAAFADRVLALDGGRLVSDRAP
jgi:ABC-type multidrug transport system fused ATPase/permease subunit